MTNTLWTITAIMAAAGCTLFGIILTKLHKQYKARFEAYQPLQVRFRYCADDVQNQPEDRRFSLLMLPMLFYMALAMVVVARNAATALWMQQAMNVLTALACLSGIVETLLLYARRAKAAPAAGLMKWGFFALWTVCMFAGLMIRGWAL